MRVFSPWTWYRSHQAGKNSCFQFGQICTIAWPNPSRSHIPFLSESLSFVLRDHRLSSATTGKLGLSSCSVRVYILLVLALRTLTLTARRRVFTLDSIHGRIEIP